MGEIGVLPVESINIEFVRRFRSKYAYTDEALRDLIKSMNEFGYMQEKPVLVEKTDDGRYEVIDGSRRVVTAKMKGINEIPAVIEEKMNSKERIKRLLVSNHRKEYDPIALSDLIYQYYILSDPSLKNLHPVELAMKIKYLSEKYKKKNYSFQSSKDGDEYDLFLQKLKNYGNELEEYISIAQQWKYIMLQNLSSKIKNKVKKRHIVQEIRRCYLSVNSLQLQE